MVKIITIDGPASSGKGTVAKIIAKKLGFNYLDSGAIYRTLAIAILNNGIISEAGLNTEISESGLLKILNLIETMQLTFINERVMLNNVDISDTLRAEKIGLLASNIAKIALIRTRLLGFQRDFVKNPGLVTDGRDMGSIVFPEANLKIYLTSDPLIRAQRRFTQLQSIGISVKIADILADVERRDLQDKSRKNAPLVYDNSYKVLDNSDLTIDETVSQILQWFAEIG